MFEELLFHGEGARMSNGVCRRNLPGRGLSVTLWTTHRGSCVLTEGILIRISESLEGVPSLMARRRCAWKSLAGGFTSHPWTPHVAQPFCTSPPHCSTPCGIPTPPASPRPADVAELLGSREVERIQAAFRAKALEARASQGWRCEPSWPRVASESSEYIYVYILRNLY